MRTPLLYACSTVAIVVFSSRSSYRSPIGAVPRPMAENSRSVPLREVKRFVFIADSAPKRERGSTCDGIKNRIKCGEHNARPLIDTRPPEIRHAGDSKRREDKPLQ